MRMHVYMCVYVFNVFLPLVSSADTPTTLPCGAPPPVRATMTAQDSLSAISSTQALCGRSAATQATSIVRRTSPTLPPPPLFLFFSFLFSLYVHFASFSFHHVSFLIDLFIDTIDQLSPFPSRVPLPPPPLY